MNTVAKKSKQGTLTAENLEESRKLKALYLAAEHGMSQEAFGQKYGIGNQGAVWQCLNGKGMPISLKAARGFAEGLRVDIAAFSPRLAEEAAKNVAYVPDEDEFVRVRRVGVSFSQGHGQVVYEEGNKAPLTFRRDFLRKLGLTERTALVVDAVGRSNETDIRDGAVLLVTNSENARERIRDGKFYAFRYERELFIKKLYRLENGAVKAVSANHDKSEFPDRIIDGEEVDFEIIGRALWMGAEL
ncbi:MULTISPECIES: S24 family peptidase [Variovorax]|nr:S24 family peptidase [Variovorax boronicumulans]